ncbi:hypothetical protein PFISCL1PPCAC_1491, partial [Pristionchus fissidentatus]
LVSSLLLHHTYAQGELTCRVVDPNWVCFMGMCPDDYSCIKDFCCKFEDIILPNVPTTSTSTE